MIEMHEMFEGQRFDRYHELGQAAFGRKLGLYIIVPLQLLVETSACIIYMVTGGESLKKVHQLSVGDDKCTKLTIRHFILIFASSQFVLSLLKNFNSISGVSLVAAVMSVRYGMADIIYWGKKGETIYIIKSLMFCVHAQLFHDSLGSLTGKGGPRECQVRLQNKIKLGAVRLVRWTGGDGFCVRRS